MYMPRLHHSSDCSTVPAFCTDNDLVSRVYMYIGIYRFSCYRPPTELEGDIGMTMCACCPSHLWIFCAFADILMIMDLHRPDKLLVALCPGSAISWPFISQSFSARWDKPMASLSSSYLLVVILRWIRTISSYLWYPFAYIPLTGSALNLADEFLMSFHRSDWHFAAIFNPLTRIIWLDPGQATFIMSFFTRKTIQWLQPVSNIHQCPWRSCYRTQPPLVKHGRTQMI